MAKIVRDISHRHSPHQVFSDFCEAAAISITNAVDLPQHDAREARYMEIVRRYEKRDVDRLPQLLGTLVEGLTAKTHDYLGELFHELELHNTYKGQFFTPFALCEMMAKMSFDQGALDIIESRGFIKASEPACGSGGMILALAKTMMEDHGINYQKHLHVIATDIDSRCVHMAYLQMSLMFIPAIVVHGNTLSLQEFDHWHTNAHIMNGWTFKLKRNRELNPGDHPSDQFTAATREPPKPTTMRDRKTGETVAIPRQLDLF